MQVFVPMLAYENGAAAGVVQREFPRRQSVPASKCHREEWQTRAHMEIWPQLHARPWPWGKFIWVMFDFGTDG